MLLDLDSLASFEWTRFCAFPPYTSQDWAEDSLGFAWRYRWSNVQHLDGITYLVFVDEDAVVAAFDHARGLGDFSYLDRRCYGRQLARFNVREEGLLEWAPSE